MTMSRKKRMFNDKRPVEHHLAPREHYVRKNGSWKPKMSFENEASAVNWIESHSSSRLTWRFYVCSVCGKIHLSSIRPEEDY